MSDYTCVNDNTHTVAQEQPQPTNSPAVRTPDVTTFVSHERIFYLLVDIGLTLEKLTTPG
jgi:hypothetical protein